MILADENIDHRIIAALRAAGLEVLSIYENQRGASDEIVMELARNPPRLLLTEDKDFGEWVFAHGVKDISVVFLRYTWPETEALIRTLLHLFNERWSDLKRAFTTVAVNKIRIRPL